MLYTLLPFFLAINVPVNDVTWTFGPEYTFSGHLKMITALDKDEGILMGNNLVFMLKCRPKLEARLSCRFEDTKIAKTTPNAFNVSAGEKSEEYKDAGMMKKKFEIEFNEKGIDSYVIEKSEPLLPAWCLDMTRLACNGLSIGVTISSRPDEFRVLANDTNGECQVNFTIKKMYCESITDDLNVDIGIHHLPSLQGDLHKSNVIQIEKKRDIHDCVVSSDYFFGSRYIFGIVYRHVTTKLKSSNSTIKVSYQEFKSETVNKVELFDENNKRIGDVLDHTMLRLVSISPAKEELPVLKNPVSVGIIANRPGNPYVE